MWHAAQVRLLVLPAAASPLARAVAGRASEIAKTPSTRPGPIERIGSECATSGRPAPKLRRGVVDRQAQEEGGADAELGLEAQRPAVLVDDDIASDREALAGAAADVLGGEERIVDLVADGLGDAGAGVADRDLDLAVEPARAHDDLAPGAGVADDVADGVGGVDHEVEDRLVDLAAVAAYLG